MPVKKLAKIVGAALRDADHAGKTSADPKWRREQMADRRGTLRKFETVQHAIQDRKMGAGAEGASSQSAQKAGSKRARAGK